MKRIVAVVVTSSVVLFVLGASGATAAPKLKCFSQSPASCTIGSTGRSATLDTTTGGYAGVYPANGNSHRSVADFSASFDYRCQLGNTDTVTCVGGGAPRWSIPIDTNGNNKVDGYAFIDAANCGDTGTVSTGDAHCAVFEGFAPYASYSNWADFVADNGSYRIAGLSFVIADVQTAGQITIYNPTITK